MEDANPHSLDAGVTTILSRVDCDSVKDFVKQISKEQVKNLFIGLGLANPRRLSEILDIYHTVCYTQLASQRLRGFGMGQETTWQVQTTLSAFKPTT
jgi:hypothetical protein